MNQQSHSVIEVAFLILNIMKKASENLDYKPLYLFLEKDGSEKALKMLEKIKEMQTNDEFILFKIELEYKALLNAF